MAGTPTPLPVPFWKVLALGICAMAIGPNLALSAAYQLHYSGRHSWLAFAGAALVSLLVAGAISRLAQRFDVTASILSYAKRSVPPPVTAAVAATLLLGYVIGPADGVLTEAIYLTSLLLPFSAHAAEPWAQCLTVALSSLFIGACAYRGIDVSAKIATALGIACIPVVIWITIAGAVSFRFDVRPELRLQDLSAGAILKGVFVAMAFYVGFDGVGTLASETAEPRRNVRRLLISILAIAGLTLSVGTMLQAPVLLEHIGELDAGTSPTRILAFAGGAPSVAVAVDVLLAMAALASLIGWLNISAIMIAAASRDGFLPRILARVHPRYRSPHAAVALLTFLSIALPVAMIAWTRAAPLISTVYLTNVIVLLWLIPYGIICAAALRRVEPGEKRPAGALAGVIAIAFIVGAQLLTPLNRTSAWVNAAAAGVIALAWAAFLKRGCATSDGQSFG